MWRGLREQLIRFVAIGPATPIQPTTARRGDRAREVADLQHDVGRLQQAIADRCRTESPNCSSDAPAHDAQLTALQDELDAAQRALARYQDRI